MAICWPKCSMAICPFTGLFLVAIYTPPRRMQQALPPASAAAAASHRGRLMAHRRSCHLPEYEVPSSLNVPSKKYRCVDIAFEPQLVRGPNVPRVLLKTTGEQT